MTLLSTDTTEVQRVVHNFKNHKSPGVDNIKAEVLKNVLVETVDPVTYLQIGVLM